MTSEKQTEVTIGRTRVPIGKFLKINMTDRNNPFGGWDLRTLGRTGPFETLEGQLLPIYCIKLSSSC